VLSNLFGVSFSLNLDVNDDDDFFIEKLQNMLKFWSFFYMPLARKAMIVNLILTSMLWFFITIWGGSKKSIKKCKNIVEKLLVVM
jgi:hypothetical protein